MPEIIQPIRKRMAGVAHGTVIQAHENRALALLGIGLLILGTGVGLWALIKKTSDEVDFPETLSNEGDSSFENIDFRLSSQY